jgi:hypothetical protein
VEKMGKLEEIAEKHIEKIKEWLDLNKYPYQDAYLELDELKEELMAEEMRMRQAIEEAIKKLKEVL